MHTHVHVVDLLKKISLRAVNRVVIESKIRIQLWETLESLI